MSEALVRPCFTLRDSESCGANVDASELCVRQQDAKHGCYMADDIDRHDAPGSLKGLLQLLHVHTWPSICRITIAYYSCECMFIPPMGPTCLTSMCSCFWTFGQQVLIQVVSFKCLWPKCRSSIRHSNMLARTYELSGSTSCCPAVPCCSPVQRNPTDSIRFSFCP